VSSKAIAIGLQLSLTWKKKILLTNLAAAWWGGGWLEN
jgi:hypothetical protein